MAKRKVRTAKTATTCTDTKAAAITKKPEAPKEEKKMIKKVPMKSISATQSRTVNLGDFESTRIEFTVTEHDIPGDTDINAALDALYGIVENKLDEKLKPYEDLADENACDPADVDPDVDSEDDPADVDPEDDPADVDPDPEDDDISEEAIMKMKRKELVELIKAEGIEDLDHKEYKKIGDLRTAVIDALFEDEGAADADEDPNEEWDDSEWDD